MRTLRILCSLKFRLLSLPTRKSSSSPTCIFFKFSQTPKFSRHFHSSWYLKCPQESTEAATAYSGDGSNSWSDYSTSKKEASVETYYDPISGSIRTKRNYNHSNKVGEDESNFGYQSIGDPDLSTVQKRDEVGTTVFGETIGSGRRKGKGKGKEKIKTTWVCSECGYSDGQWWGYCRSCNSSGSMKQLALDTGSGGKVTGHEVSENLVRSWLPNGTADGGPIRLTDVKSSLSYLNWRIPL